ncbi:HNH endonuclease signature motif containing protein [Microlunatus soli]|uniref:HNH endonuclease n=1 Tax=Microlunatus soli TaxID=630515 RepID=A0A1H1PY36_9ACTN|nr:HNH endonuclease signature motif containing protein [Microlunatus soli]SDS16088.1 HNH endonuclease [Microlunatus soli]
MTVVDQERDTVVDQDGRGDGPEGPADPYALGGRLMAAAGDLSRQEAVFLELVGLFDAIDGYRSWDGIRSTAHWLSWACAIAPGTAREHLRVARALLRMPDTRAAFASGDLTFSKVRELTRLVDHFIDPDATSEGADDSCDVATPPGAQPHREVPAEGRPGNGPSADVHGADGDQPVDPGEAAGQERGDVDADGPASSHSAHSGDSSADVGPSDVGAVPSPCPATAAIASAPDRPDEAKLIRFAQCCTAQQLARVVTSYRAVEGTSRRRRDRQRVSWVTRDDGNIHITMVLPPEEGAAVVAAIQSATDASSTQDDQAEPGAVVADDRQPGQSSDEVRAEARERTRVEAVCEIANHYLASRPEDRSGEDRTLVVLEVSSSALAATSSRPPAGPLQGAGVPSGTGRLDSTASDSRATDSNAPASAAPGSTAPRTPPPHGVPTQAADVPAGTVSPPTTSRPALADPHDQTCRVRGAAAIETSAAQRALCDSRIVAIITDQYGEPLAVSREQRLATRAQRRALMIRDGCCQYPGCNQTRRLQAHHRVRWSDGGKTDLDNLLLLCQWHHTRVHEDKISISRCGHPGCPIRWQFTRPDNSTIAPIVAGREERNPWRPMSDALGRPLPEPAREAARIRNDHRVADFTGRQTALAEQQQALEDRYRHIDCPDHPDAQRVFPVGGGAGFNLAACVDALFGMVPLPAGQYS